RAPTRWPGCFMGRGPASWILCVCRAGATRTWRRRWPSWAAPDLDGALPPVTGIERIAEAFAGARAEGRRAALMPYLMGGFPDLDTSRAIARAYAESGADLVELGVPFSDPLADGPVIQAAGTAALRAGATLDHVLAVAREISQRVPVVVMCYSNLVLARGRERFADALLQASASGLIVPDL